MFILVSRLENLVSDRRLVEHCSLRLDILYFLGYEVDEGLPRHSTISRIRQLFPAAVFQHVFAQCVAAGLVVDSAPVKANAALKSLCKEQSADAPSPTRHVAGGLVPDVPAAQLAATISSPAHELCRVATTHARCLRNASGLLGRSRPQARLLSNKIHCSPADPEAVSHLHQAGEGARPQLPVQHSRGRRPGVITHIQADFADRRGSVLLESIVAPLHQRLLAHDLPVQKVVADTGYSNGVNYAPLETRSIAPWIPVFGNYQSRTAGFTYAAGADCFTCLAGKKPPVKSFGKNQDGGLAKLYRASSRDCRLDSHQPTWALKVQERKFIRTAYAPHQRRALARKQSRQSQPTRRLRQRTIEPVLAASSGITAYARSMREGAAALTEQCCSVPSPSIGRNCSITSPNKYCAWPSRCPNQRLNVNLCASGGGLKAVTSRWETDSNKGSGILQQPQFFLMNLMCPPN